MSNLDKTKFRRVLLVSDLERDHPWEPILLRYAMSVTHVSLLDWACADLLNLPAAAMVVDDKRSTNKLDRDILMTRSERMIPVRPCLFLYDVATTSEWDLAALNFGTATLTALPYTADTFEVAITAFMSDCQAAVPEGTTNFDYAAHQYASRTLLEIMPLMSPDAPEDDVAAMRLAELAFMVSLGPKEAVQLLRQALATSSSRPTPERFTELLEFVHASITASIAAAQGDDSTTLAQAYTEVPTDHVTAVYGMYALVASKLVTGLAMQADEDPQEFWRDILLRFAQQRSGDDSA